MLFTNIDFNIAAKLIFLMIFFIIINQICIINKIFISNISISSHKNFIKNKDDITRVFNYTGMIDSLLSIENVIANSSVENPYTFTKFIKNNTPCLITKDVWHPYLDSSSTVKNDIELKNNILITGPNAAGKSTFIKSIILNIILYHLTTNDVSNPIILIIGVLFGGLCYSQKDAVKELLKIQSNI